ncbi:polyphosphate kinase 2 [Pseudanabaena sp. FACHB-1277]|uniref:ADP/GDP-polyphosphate phosphotransferase n=1 Tax=Pseudanabaena cinerea FACHB-1277 TaxID=2949581 RepID=A0A926UVX4_9CYAN|nr:polyphosphate kinase 2 [Pseudanabaena cinerea]MBD2151032.1 polyphosphate kinase 2 [Pseudanabaena cinerea FACHB-1277]
MAKDKKSKDHSAKSHSKKDKNSLDFPTSAQESSQFTQENDQAIAVIPKLSKKTYEKELAKLEIELVKLQEWIKQQGLKVVIIFEGRDAAGKGGAIKSITQCLNPRLCRVVALGKPSDYERTQWYFQRYTAQLPAAGEMVLFDRSWYNRAGVEHVMGYCTHEEYVEFLRSCPEFEDMIQRSGITLIKYWFSVSDNEQEIRFRDRIKDPRKRWKFSPMDLEARARWVEYSKAKDDMFNATDTQLSPWYTINADDKRRARLNCISHLLAKIPYEDVLPAAIELPPIQNNMVYVRPPMHLQNFIPDVTGNLR